MSSSSAPTKSTKMTGIFPSSSRASIFERALSPQAQSYASAATGGDSIDDTVRNTTHTISTAANMEQLIPSIPSRLRSTVAPVLREMQDTHKKLCSAQRALADLEQHTANGSWPQYLPAINNPFKAVQSAKEARDSTLPLLSEANSEFAKYKSQVLLTFCQIKKAEVDALEKKCKPANVGETLSKLISKHRESVAKEIGQFVVSPIESDGSGGKPERKLLPFVQVDYDLAEQLTIVWVAKVWDFGRASSDRTAALLKKKKDLATAAKEKDVDMPDAPSSTINAETIAKIATDAAVKAIEGKIFNKKGQGRGQVSTKSLIPNPVTYTSLGKRERFPEQEDRAPKRQKTTGRDSEIPPKCPRHQSQATKSCFRCRERTRWEEEQEIKIISSKWNPDKPSSFPKQILDLPEEKAISLIQSRIPLSRIVNADLKVKLGPGVTSIPGEIDDIISLGHRFLFPSTFSLEVPMISYMSLARRIKWQIHFFYLKKEPSFLDRFPQFRISRPETTVEPKTTPVWAETMLEKGRLELLRQLEAMPSTAANLTMYPEHKKDLALLRDWRRAHPNLLVLQSDKNLGTTIVDSQWYSSKLDNLVLNNKDFEQISEVNYLQMMENVFNEIKNFDNEGLIPEIREYILANCNRESAEKNLPKFHGLPKVHKEPWALRPIVPCHSYPLTNASKALSQALKPLIQESPWILESTQDLARTLEGIKLDQSKKYWLCTGDVTAMYPNIPRDRAHQILGVIAGRSCTAEPTKLIQKLAQWSDNFLAFRHGNKVFYQREGLAMGIPSAPDVANLYMSYFEDSFADNFLLYKRYIDDVFVIVEAPTRKDALKALDVIQADNLTLTWSVDKVTINFLDLQITQEAGYLSFQPYRKPLNSYERLPYNSYHPIHVKRAAFSGEISRMARICSKHDFYFDQVAYVRDIYLKRGYPRQLLARWIRNEAKSRWANRYKDSSEDEGGRALWMKSTYNNVWSFIDLHKVWSAMNEGRPVNTRDSPLEHIEDVKLSLKRFRNLGEINNKYNADVLRDFHVEEVEVDIRQAVESIQPLPETSQPILVDPWTGPGYTYRPGLRQTRLNFPVQVRKGPPS